MSWRNYQNKGKGGRKPTRSTDYNDIVVKDSTMPTPESRDEAKSMTFAAKSLRGLPMSQTSITVKADPYAQVLPASEPYALLKADSPKFGGIYKGQANLQGAGVKQYLTSQSSKFLNAFDIMHMSNQCNYNYLPIRKDDLARGLRMVQTTIKAMSEAMSNVTSTTMMLQPAMSYVVKTDLPLPKDDGSALESNYSKVRKDQATVFYVLGVFYQCILQACCQAVNRYSKFRGAQGEMMRRSWNRETPRLNSLFGLMNKKALQTVVLSVGYSIEGEYFDMKFMEQISTATAILGAKSGALTDALLEMDTIPNIPSKLTVYAGVDDAGQPVAQIFDFDASTGDGKAFMDAINSASEVWSVAETLYWARTYNTGSESMQSRYNTAVDAMQDINNFMTGFKIAFTDYRAILDIMAKVGFNNWSRIFRPGISRDTDIPVPYNLTVQDIFKLFLSGCTTLKYNEETKRWNGLALWNKYTGIPEYEAWNGGSVLAFCLKDLSGGDDTAVGYLPRFYDSTSDIYAVNRLGTKVKVGTYTMSPAAVAADPAVARLQPLASVQREIKVPYIYKTEGSTGSAIKDDDRSALIYTLLNLFDMAAYSTNGSDYKVYTDPDLLAFIDYEIEDYSNQVLAFCRSNGPFRVNTATTDGLGFGQS